MELWIRSQDKNFLCKIDNIYATDWHDWRDKEKPTYWRIHTKDFGLGMYKTKERALEILDEIQSLIQPKFDLSDYSDEEREKILYTFSIIQYPAHENGVYVYELPKE